MSVNDAKRLISDLDRKDDLRRKLHGAAEEIVRAAIEQGYEVTREEISDALKEHWKTAKGPFKPHDCKIKFSEAPGF